MNKINFNVQKYQKMLNEIKELKLLFKLSEPDIFYNENNFVNKCTIFLIQYFFLIENNDESFRSESNYSSDIRDFIKNTDILKLLLKETRKEIDKLMVLQIGICTGNFFKIKTENNISFEILLKEFLINDNYKELNKKIVKSTKKEKKEITKI